ncbi:hypothetical protein EVAR_92994_1 [Eumeta japonica]|uniref:Uncharacterized protein n=1 Tax=Eumeta variegata TaxID=151549 RepID=A0A4C1TAM6_EUMVA|nr:hypothetical protein EVAR_92994_1 [Eumeta japonica]
MIISLQLITHRDSLRAGGGRRVREMCAVQRRGSHTLFNRYKFTPIIDDAMKREIAKRQNASVTSLSADVSVAFGPRRCTCGRPRLRPPTVRSDTPPSRPLAPTGGAARPSRPPGHCDSRRFAGC